MSDIESQSPQEPVVVTIQLTLDQAHAVMRALDLFSRLSIGQLEEVANLVVDELIPLAKPHSQPREVASAAQCDAVRDCLNQAKAALGYQANGSNGIGHPHVSKIGLRAYEIKKELAKALAVHRDPNPPFKGVDYDGNIVDYTGEPKAIVSIETRLRQMGERRE